MSDSTIISQLFPTISKETVIQLNRMAQLLGIIFGIQALYEIHTYKFLKNYFTQVGKLNRYFSVVVNKNQFTVGLKLNNLSITHEPQIDSKILFVVTIVIITIFLFTNYESPFYWYAYPFIKVYEAFYSWYNLEINLWSILLQIVTSFLLILWGIVSFSLIFSFCGIIPIKCLALISQKLSVKFSKMVYRFILLLEFLISAIIILITS